MANQEVNAAQLMAAMTETMRMVAETQAQLAGTQAAQRVYQDTYSAKELERMAQEFMKQSPTFERGKDRWQDFSRRFIISKNRFHVSDEIAKEVLWNAIRGRSSRIVISSMAPTEGAYANVTFTNYMNEMAEKFTPASESLQMKTEYKSRVQVKSEDVQTYINEKYEMFKLAYPGGDQDLSDFYVEVTKGIANKYVRNNLWSYQATSVADYGTKAVFWVQVERQRIANGDSETGNLEGLVPVTRTGNKGGKEEPMEIDTIRQEEDDEDDSEECECAALQEQGFRGNCYYCQRRGHLLRSCPRKSAGLPKIRNPGTNSGKPSYQKQVKTGTYTQKKYPQKTYPGKKVNHITEEAENVDEDEYEEEQEEQEAEESAHFLGKPL